MADNKIRFTLESFFKDEGMKKASDSLGEITRQTKDTTKVFGLFDGVLGQISPTLGRTLEAFQSLFGAIKSGAGTLAALTFAITGVNFAWSQYKKYKDEIFGDRSSGLTDEITKVNQMEAAYRRLAKAVERLNQIRKNQEIANTVELRRQEVKALNEVISAYQKLTDAQSKTNSSQSRLNIAKITDAFSLKLQQAADDLDKNVLTAQRDLAIALEDNKVSIENATTRYEASRISLNTLNEAINAQKEVVALNTQLGNVNAKEQEKLNALLEEKELKEEELKQATINLQTVRLEAETKEREYKEELEKTTAETEKAKKERTALAEAEKKSAEQAQKDAELAERKRKDDEVQAKAERTARDKLITELNRQMEALQSDRVKAAVNNYLAKLGMEADAAAQDWTPYNYNLTPDGKPGDVTDYVRASGRYASRALRDRGFNGGADKARDLEMKAEAGTLTPEEEYEYGKLEAAKTGGKRAVRDYEKYNRLKNKKNLSKQEKKFMKDYEDWHDSLMSEDDWENAANKIMSGSKTGGNGKSLKDVVEAIEEMSVKN